MTGPLTTALTAASSWAPWWEQVTAGEAVTVTLDLAGTGEVGFLAGPGGTPAKWTTDKRVRCTGTARLVVALPATTGGLWRLGLYRRSGSVTVTATVRTAAPAKPVGSSTTTSTTSTTTGGSVPLYRLTQQLRDLPAGTVVRRKDTTRTPAYRLNLDGPLSVADNSNWWRTLVAGETALNDRSEAYRDRILAAIDLRGLFFERQQYATALFATGADAVRYDVGYDDTARNSSATKIPSGFLAASNNAPFLQAPFPPDLVIPSGRDGAVAIIDTDDDTVSNFWRLKDDGLTVPSGPGRVVVPGSPYLAAHGGRIVNVSQSWAGTFPPNQGVSASGMLNVSGIIGVEEAQAVMDGDVHAIRHAIGICLPNSDIARGSSDRPYSKPANRTDGGAAADDTAAVPMGVRGRFDPTWDPATLSGRHLFTQALGWAMRDYGFTVFDSATLVTIGGELPLPEDVATYGGNPWNRVLAGTNSGALLGPLPWARAQFLPHDWKGTRP